MIFEAARAKLNLALHVTGRREDGYHLLDSLVAFADIGDRVALMPGPLSLKIDGPKAMVPADFLLDPEGLVWKAHYGKAITDHIDMDEIRAFQEDQCLDMPEAPPN